MSGGELCTTCQSLLFLTWTSCLWLSWRNVFTCRTGLCFLFGRGFLSRLWVSWHLSSIYSHASGLEQIWSILLSLCPSFPSGDAPWPRAVLCSQHSPQPSLFPLPAFPHLSLGTCVGQRVWNSQIPTPCVYPQSRLPHITPWPVGNFFFLNKEQIWGLIYKSWVFPSPGTPKTSEAFSFSICL